MLGLFAGVGGIELGLRQAGLAPVFLCESDPHAAEVLRLRFGLEVAPDVRTLLAPDLPPADLVAAGFPCQDLSQAGRTAGVFGERSGVVVHVLRLLERMRPLPSWLLLENVPFMLSLERGRAMTWLTEALTQLGWAWAYRTIDTRSLGLPQRRRRVLLLASPRHDPREVLFSDDHGPIEFGEDGAAFGFYWTEGRRGLGWAVDAIPPLKAGSGIGIPSPPAIWLPSGELVTPDLRDAERLQGFPADGKKCSNTETRATTAARWRMVGNAVSVPVATWIGERLIRPGRARFDQRPLALGRTWPRAAWGCGRQRFEAMLTECPLRRRCPRLADFLRFPPHPLSLRAAEGFRSRTRRGSLRFRPGFLDAVDEHIVRLRAARDPNL